MICKQDLVKKLWNKWLTFSALGDKNVGHWEISNTKKEWAQWLGRYRVTDYLRVQIRWLPTHCWYCFSSLPTSRLLLSTMWLQIKKNQSLAPLWLQFSVRSTRQIASSFWNCNGGAEVIGLSNCLSDLGLSPSPGFLFVKVANSI